jgi:uncharacterized coiled-coil protein SlyX
MPVDVSKLNAAITALTAEVARTEGTEDSAGKLITGFAAQLKQAVADALTADAAANQASIDAANSAIDAVTARFVAADDKLGAAVATVTPPPPPPPPPPVG